MQGSYNDEGLRGGCAVRGAAHPGGEPEVAGGDAGVGRGQPDAAGAAALRALPPLGRPVLHQGAKHQTLNILPCMVVQHGSWLFGAEQFLW